MKIKRKIPSKRNDWFHWTTTMILLKMMNSDREKLHHLLHHVANWTFSMLNRKFDRIRIRFRCNEDFLHSVVEQRRMLKISMTIKLDQHQQLLLMMTRTKFLFDEENISKNLVDFLRKEIHWEILLFCFLLIDDRVDRRVFSLILSIFYEKSKTNGLKRKTFREENVVFFFYSKNFL